MHREQPRFHWIDSAAELARAAEGWAAETVLAIDTEFVRERTFYPMLGLVQVGDSTGCHLVDPLAIDDLSPLDAVLSDPGILKVAHSCSEDMEVLYHRFGAFPTPLFDTQVGAALAGLEPSLSYQRLVQELLGVELEKGATRSDWLQRPLSEVQLVYATLDVDHLRPAFERLEAAVRRLGRFDWVLEESARLEDASRFLPDPDDAYLRLKGIGGFDGRQMVALQRLAAWREREARRRDVPRSFVIRDAALITLARRRPTSPEELATIDGISKRMTARHGECLLGLVGDPPEPGPPPPRPPSLPRSEQTKALLKRLGKLVSAKATELGVAGPVLASRREQRDLLRDALDGGLTTPPPPFDGWRWEVLGEPVERLVAEARSAGWGR